MVRRKNAMMMKLKDHDEVDRDGEEQFEGGGENSTASDSDSASNVQVSQKSQKR